MNHFTISGNAGGDPEIKFSDSGTAICSFSVAVNEKKGGADITHWFDVVCFNSLAENVVETIVKGTSVVVSGKLEQRSWETANGDKRSKVELIAWNVAPDLNFAIAAVTKNKRDDR